MVFHIHQLLQTPQSIYMNLKLDTILLRMIYFSYCIISSVNFLIFSIFSTIAFIAAGIGVVYFFTGGIKTKSFMKPKVSEKGTETTEDLLAGSNFSPKTRRKKQD